MVRWFAIGLLCAGGCFDAEFEDGLLSCESSLICPVGLACVDGRCVSGVSDAGPGADAPPDASPILRSCADYLAAGEDRSGEYTINPAGEPRQVLCEMTTGGGGWTVLVANDNGDSEPEGCVPRIASVADLACGPLEVGEDFAVLASDIPFTEMAWVALGDMGDPVAYRLFEWTAPQVIPEVEQWSLTPDDPEPMALDFGTLPLIACEFAPGGAAGLRRVANATVRQDTGPWMAGEVITVFDQETTAGNPGRMSLFGADPMDDNLEGLDDFQDGFGCADDWEPTSERGASSVILIR